MLYNYLKIFHILCAAFLLTSIGYSCYLWKRRQAPFSSFFERIQKQTWAFILPFALLQLMTGFTMISIKHEDLAQSWVKGSVIGFIAVITSWFTFIYFLISSQQSSKKIYARWQLIMLIICTISLLSMIFFMANKIA